MTTGAEAGLEVNLAGEADFRLGAAAFSPSLCRVRVGDREERIEPRVMQVLVCLTRAEGRTVSRDALIEACWEGRAVTDDAVNRVIAKARQVARLTEPPAFVLETVPKIGFRLTAAGAAPEVAPPSIEGPAPPESASTAAGVDGWQARLKAITPRNFAIGAAAVAAVVGVTGFLLTRPAPAPPTPRVEVVQFQPATPSDAELERRAGRLSQSLLTLLAAGNVPALQAVAQPDAGGAPESNANLRIAGSLDRDAEAVRISAQVIDRETGLLLWTDEVERPAAEAEGIELQMGYEVVGALRCALQISGTTEKAVTPEVFSVMLNLCDSLITGDGDSLSSARRLVEMAPGISGAHSMLSAAAAWAALQFESAPEQAAALKAESLAAAQKSIEINPESGLGYAGLAFLEQDDVKRSALLERSLSLMPDHPVMLSSYIALLRETGRLRAAGEYSERLLRIPDPRVVVGMPLIAFNRAMAGDLEGATEVIDMMDSVRADSGGSVRWTVAVWWEDPQQTLARFDALASAGHPSPGAVKCFREYLTRLIAARGAALRGLPGACSALPVDWRTRLLARQGDIDGAYALFPNDRRRGRPAFVFYPEMRAFRHDPRFMPLMDKIGLVRLWRETDRWPDFCEEPDLPYDCKAYRS